jgi:(2R)-ethylmalonyl-CoA mutase
MARLAAYGVDIPVIVGGILPEDDQATLLASGVTAVYTPKDYDISRIMREIAEIAQAHRVPVSS